MPTTTHHAANNEVRNTHTNLGHVLEADALGSPDAHEEEGVERGD
eukprot:CAMPEP_0119475346 /NCGR_PEP_ID=MMETSP1344-20130328/6271_1 /TAXON_ID=236787 /ORGANISM="Florenciella parvula, Strain CCMP2471" /LENGTH=44 /DNA_ID= /DNA_START= /DNA_END= /DNA_ORIENTATION=